MTRGSSLPVAGAEHTASSSAVVAVDGPRGFRRHIDRPGLVLEGRGRARRSRRDPVPSTVTRPLPATKTRQVSRVALFALRAFAVRKLPQIEADIGPAGALRRHMRDAALRAFGFDQEFGHHSHAALFEISRQVLIAHLGIFGGLGLLRILLGLDHRPAGIADQFLAHGGIIDAAVARHGIDAGEYAIEERPVLLLGFGADRRAHILGVEMADPRFILAREHGRIGAAPGRVPGIEQQVRRPASYSP